MAVFITTRNGVPEGNVLIYVFPQGVGVPMGAHRGQFKLIHLGTPSPSSTHLGTPPNLFELVQSVAHRTIGKAAFFYILSFIFMISSYLFKVRSCGFIQSHRFYLSASYFSFLCWILSKTHFVLSSL